MEEREQQPNDLIASLAAGPPPSDLAAFIRANHERILVEWEQAVRRMSSARPLSRPALRDHLPDLLGQLAESLEEVASGHPPRWIESMPDRHALVRLDEGFDLKEIVTEYSVLRATIERLWEEAEPERVSRKQIRVLDRAIDLAVAASVERYTRARERTLVALDRLSAAALGDHATLDGFLSQLLGVLQGTTEAVDTAAILLRDGSFLRTRATVGLERGAADGFSLRIGEGFAGRIAAERRPVELDASELERSLRNPVLRDRGLRTAYGVPLLKQEELMGVALMCSRTAYQFSDEDKLLFRMMANRATAFITQAEVQALLDTLLAASPVGMAFLDKDLRFVRVNEALASANGRSVDQHLGKAVTEVLQDQAASFEPALRGIVATGKPVLNLELVGEPPSTPGEVRHFLGNYFPVRSATGEPVGVGAIVLEITDRKKAEQKLQERELQARALADNIDQLAWMTDAEGKVYWVNKRWTDYSGATLEEVQGFGWKQFHHPEHIQRVTDNFSRCLQRGEVWEDTFPLRRKDGEYRWFLTRALPIRDEHGNVTRWFGTNTDITEQRQAADELRQTAGFRDQFIGILGHDLQSPLQAIRTSADLMLRRGELAPPHARTLARIANTADRMGRMISDILDFARGQLGQGIPVRRQRINVHEVVTHAVEEVRDANPGRTIELEIQGHGWGSWDPDRIAQVISNLVGNAIVHGCAQSPIQVFVRDCTLGVRLEVRNQGTVIPLETQATLWEPFRRGPEGEPGKRLGLGLFIVKKIVDAHAGRVEVSSTEEGTAFGVELPRG